MDTAERNLGYDAARVALADVKDDVPAFGVLVTALLLESFYVCTRLDAPRVTYHKGTNTFCLYFHFDALLISNVTVFIENRVIVVGSHYYHGNCMKVDSCMFSHEVSYPTNRNLKGYDKVLDKIRIHLADHGIAGVM